MATFTKDDQAKASKTPGEIVWTDLVPKHVDSEDTMSPVNVSKTWEKLYAKVGMSQGSESEKAGVRLGVYTYGALNGTSREGNYAGLITLSNGKTIPASAIPAATGRYEIRRFFRGNMKEAYTALKSSGVLLENPKFVAHAAALGVSADNAFATADWFTDCPYFTVAEARAHDMVMKHGLDRSRRAREGRSLDEVESDRVMSVLEVQGPKIAPSRHGAVEF